MSLDGFIAGPKLSVKQPMGQGGERLHDWLFKTKTENDAGVMAETIESSGAVIVGGRTYKIAIDDAWGGVSPFDVPAFVLTHHIPSEKREGFVYITADILETLWLAKKNGREKKIMVNGGADLL